MAQHSSPKAPAFASATHAALYAPQPARCDACGAPIETDAEADDEALPGAGVYVFARGDEVRREEVPLCPSCSLAIGIAALGDQDYEEEEG